MRTSHTVNFQKVVQDKRQFFFKAMSRVRGQTYLSFFTLLFEVVSDISIRRPLMVAAIIPFMSKGFWQRVVVNKQQFTEVEVASGGYLRWR